MLAAPDDDDDDPFLTSDDRDELETNELTVEAGPAEQARLTRQLPEQYFRRISLLFILINT